MKWNIYFQTSHNQVMIVDRKITYLSKNTNVKNGKYVMSPTAKSLIMKNGRVA